MRFYYASKVVKCYQSTDTLSIIFQQPLGQSAQNLIAVDAADFSIGDDQHVNPRVDDEAAGDNLEVACQQQDGVECVWVVGELWVDRILGQDFCHRLPLDEAQQIVLSDGITKERPAQSEQAFLLPVGLLFEFGKFRYSRVYLR